MSNPWTPGPWVQYAHGDTVYGADGFFIAAVQSKNPNADARLIAEAPAMAEALEACLRLVDGDGLPPDWDNLRAILARIKGAA